jgi:precorrin-3B synthase
MIALATKRLLAGGFTRRGACPALSAPMQTGDGLLVRLNPVAGGLSPKSLIGLCEAAEACGNGVVEVTARGSLQIRGLTEHSASPFAQAVDRLGISVRTGVPVQTGALAGVDPDEIVDPTALAESIRTGISRARLDVRLGPKVSVVIDGGGRTALAEVAADVRLTAVEACGELNWLVAIAGDARTARPLGIARGDKAASVAALALLSEIAGMGRSARARDLSSDSLHVAPLAYAITSTFGGAKERDTARSLIGNTSLRDRHVAVGIALPFGHTTAKLLKAFAETAEQLGIEDIRPAPRRTLVAICQSAVQAETLRKTAETLGFVTSPDDPRQAISACPGAPQCASGYIPARKIAAEIAEKYSDMLDGSVHLHVSGCAKGCAHPAAAGLVMVGGDSGTGLVGNGTARDEPLGFVESDGARRAFANVARLVATERKDGETAAQTIQRIGVSATTEAFGRKEK